MSLKLTVLGLSMLLALPSVPAFAAVDRCVECGMRIDGASPFIARLAQSGTMHHFCDIGDLFTYLRRKGPDAGIAEVRDFSSGAWIDARTAFYVTSPKKFRTPMGWGIAAFSRRDDAMKSGAAMDFNGAMNSLKQ